MARFDVTDGEWALIEPLLPPLGLGAARVDDRRVVNAIFWVLRTARPGGTCPSVMAPIRRLIAASTAGRSAAYGWRCSSGLRHARRSRCSSSTPPSCERTSMPPPAQTYGPPRLQA